jgi:hypothetical protein
MASKAISGPIIHIRDLAHFQADGRANGGPVSRVAALAGVGWYGLLFTHTSHAAAIRACNAMIQNRQWLRAIYSIPITRSIPSSRRHMPREIWSGGAPVSSWIKLRASHFSYSSDDQVRSSTNMR